jgi:hypothetical protein
MLIEKTAHAGVEVFLSMCLLRGARVVGEA